MPETEESTFYEVRANDKKVSRYQRAKLAASNAAAAAKSVRPDPNAKHKAEYCGPLVAGDAAAVAQHDFLSSHFGDQIERDHNYTIRDWC